MNARTPNTQDAARADTGRDAGYLSEMFCSVQGEGPHVGERHVFFRTAGCTATCSWCDTVYSKVQTPRFVIHGREKRAIPNPVSTDVAVDELMAFARANDPIAAVSITGGEPLEQPEFVREVARRVRAAGRRVYLETNGVHPGALGDMLADVDVVAMDIKLPSAIGVEEWDAHRAFLSVAAGGNAETFVKVVVDPASTLDEIDTAAGIIADADPSIALILQPESGALLSPDTPRETLNRLLETIEFAQKRAMKRLDNVRVMPQCHKIIRVR